MTWLALMAENAGKGTVILAATAAWFFVGAARTSRLVGRSAPAPYAPAPGSNPRVRVLHSAETPMPLTWGILRPVVLLPADAARWSRARLSAVLLHELTHVRRRDVLAQAIAQLACCLYWFHPAVWYALRGRKRAPVSPRAAVAVAAAVLAVVLPLASLTAYAQARGALAGIVEDASGARVPHCEVTAINQDGTNREITRSDAAGEYGFASIPPGRYTLEFRMRGFALLRAQATVAAGVPSRLDGKLDVDTVSEALVIKGQRSTPAALPAARAPERIRVGGNVQATRLISQVRPEYPADLQRAGIQGTVLLRAVISTAGDLANLDAVNTAVDPGLVRAALDAVRQWRYQPTLLNGQPVEVVTTITVDFRLE